MREQLNSNPLVQLAVVGVLLIGVAIFIMSSGGGGEEEEPAGATEATVSVAGTDASGTATGATPGEAVEGAVEAATEGASAGAPAAGAAPAPPWSTLPAEVRSATRSGGPVVILLVRGGNELDDFIDRASARFACCISPDSRSFHVDERFLYGELQRLRVQLFVAGAQYVSRLAAITTPLGVDRVPALIVLRPGRPSDGGLVQGTVSYGYLTYESVAQAVIDAGYKGKTLDYHP